MRLEVLITLVLCVPAYCKSREVQLLTGRVQTTRTATGERRLLSDGASSGLFLLGVSPLAQEAVATWMLERGVEIVNAVGTEHWLVRIQSNSADVLGAALAQFEDLTWAPFTPEHKQAPTLSSLTTAVRAYMQAVAAATQFRTAGQASSVGEGDEEESSTNRGPSSRASALGASRAQLLSQITGMRTARASNGEVQVRLRITGSTPPVGLPGPEHKAAAAVWAAQLQAGLATQIRRAPEHPCAPSISATGGSGTATVTLCVPDVEAATDWLLRQDSVLYASVQKQAITHDVLAVSTIQAGKLPRPLTDVRDTAASSLPFWKAGLDGRGQVVGVVDTGLDMDSCFVFDPRYPNIKARNSSTVVRDPDTNITYYQMPNHRKVVAYVPANGRDLTDDTDSHGTHVAALVAGSMSGFDPITQTGFVTGAAPNARVAFYDVSDPKVEANPGELNAMPDDTPGALMETLWKIGARVVSNSWGVPVDGYDVMECTALDSYLWARQDLVAVFSAGNEGAQIDRIATLGTLGSRAVCQNVVAVGATDSYVTDTQDTSKMLTVNQTQVELDFSKFRPSSFFSASVTVTGYRQSNNGKGSNTTGSKSFTVGLDLAEWDLSASGQPVVSWLKIADGTEVVLSNPLDACGNLTGSYKGRVVLAERGNCSFMDKGHAASAAGAAGILLYNSNPGEGRLTPGGEAFYGIPTGMVTLAAGQWLRAILANSSRTLITVGAVAVNQTEPYESIADFSSFGVQLNKSLSGKQDQRIKPEIVAPGYTLSAASDGKYSSKMDKCATVLQHGTSMSCPIVAGGAALVRQYFVDGFYPSGEKVAGAGFEPSAALVRAVLAGGAASMTGYVMATGQRLQPAPSNFQGFGRMDLSRALPLKGSSAGWKLQVIDRAVFQNIKSNHTYQVKATGEGPLIITLAWMDWPGFPGKVPILTNDLDLTVRGPYPTKAGGSTKGSQGWYGNNMSTGDGENNIERVVINAPKAGWYTLTVKPFYLFILARPQPYSLTVLGGVSGTVETPFNPAHARMNKNLALPA